MRTLSRKAALLVLPAILALSGWIAIPAQPGHALQFCVLGGRQCFNEGESRLCQYFGCCGRILTGFCVCSEGRWDCPIPPECPPDFCP